MPYLGIVGGIEAVGERRSRHGHGASETVRIPPAGDRRRNTAIGGAIDLEVLIVFVVVDILCDLIQVLLQVSDRAPHRSESKPLTTTTMLSTSKYICIYIYIYAYICTYTNAQKNLSSEASNLGKMEHLFA